MKTLAFSEPIVFELLYEALCSSTVSYTYPQIRQVSKLFDKLDAVSVLKNGEDGRKGLRTLMSPQTVDVEDAEFETLANAFKSTMWSGFGIRYATKVVDWFDTYQEN